MGEYVIKAGDLRIGNYLKLVGEEWSVQERDKITEISASDIVDIDLSKAKGFEAVPLDRDILQKAGFISTDDNELQLPIDDDNKLVANPYIEGGYAVQLCCQTTWSGQKPRYLHQLQNLYHALTGEELVVRLKQDR